MKCSVCDVEKDPEVANGHRRTKPYGWAFVQVDTEGSGVRTETRCPDCLRRPVVSPLSLREPRREASDV